MKHLKLFFALFAMLALGVTNAWGAALGSGYEKVTDISTLSAGDRVVLYADDISKGVTGWNGNKDATVAESGWVEYLVEGASGGVYLKDETANKYITSPGSDNVFKYGTQAVCSVNASGVITCGSKYLYNQSTYVRMYADKSSDSKYKPFYVYKVVTSGGTEPPTPTTQYTIKWHTAKGVTTDVTLNEGATITKPATDPTMTGYEFMGWTEDCEVASDGAGFTAIENFGTATEDKDYYAVFAEATTTSGGGSTEYTLVNTISEGTYLIAVDMVNSSKYNFAIGTASGGHAAVEATGVTKSNTISSVPSEAKEYVLTGDNTNGYSIKCDDKYLVATGDKKSLSYSTTCSETWTFQVSGSGFHLTGKTYGSKMSSNSTTAASSIRNYASSGSFYNPLYFFKKSSGSTTTTYDNYITTCASGIEYVELGDDFKWSATEAEVTINATDNVFPTLTNTHNVPVEYSSSDDAIATIADGTVTLKKEGTVTITAKYAGGTSAGTDKEYKAKTVTYSLKVNKAAPVASGTTYVKVTSTEGITNGEYLIVYEDGKVAFNGALTTLDAVGNTIEVEITDGTIAGTNYIDAATFTIDNTAGTLKSASGKYIGVSSNSNGLKTEDAVQNYKNAFSIDDSGNAVIAAVFDNSNMSLRYNEASNQARFRYYGSGQQAITLYKKASKHTVTIADCTNGSVSAKMGETALATNDQVLSGIQITLNNTPAENYKLAAYDVYKTGESSTKVTVTDSKFIMPEHDVTISATFELAKTLTGIEITTPATQTTFWQTETFNHDGLKVIAHFDGAADEDVTDKVTVNGSTVNAGTVAVEVSFTEGSTTKTTNYDITVKATANGKETAYDVATAREIIDKVSTADNVYVTGIVSEIVTPYNSEYGNITYNISADGLTTSNQLQAFRGKSYNGENFTSADDIQVGDEVIVKGDLLKFESIYELNANNQLVNLKRDKQQAGLAYAVTELAAEVGATDFAEPELTNPNGLSVEYSTSDATLATVDETTGDVTIGSKAGTVTITASFAGNEDYVAGEASYTINITDPSISEVTFVAGTDKSDTKSISKNGITVEFADGSFSRDDNYRCYVGQSMTISYADGNITKIVIECTANDGAEYGPGQFTTETATYSYSGKVGTWTGEANSVTFTNIKQVRMTAITVYYKQDNRAEAGLAWNPAAVSLTVGDAFTAPTFSNPNTLEVSFESSNTELATVDNAGVISLVSGKIGTATITATYAGNETYKPAEVTCTITVDHKSEDVVILAKCKDQYYAMVAEYVEGKTDVLQALPVEYVGGKIYNVATDEQKASITWKRVVVDGKTTFKNGDNYLSAVNSAALKLATETCDWVFEGDMYKIEGADRTILYYATTGGFKNYSIGNMSPDGVSGEYSSTAITVAPVFADGDAYHRTTTPKKFGTICLPYGSNNYTGAEFYALVQAKADGVVLASVETLEAGVPYIFKATATELAVYSDGTTVTGAGNHNGLYGTFTDNTEVTEGNYILKDNAICEVAATCYVNKNRAYVVMSEVPTEPVQQMPGRRYIGMDVHGENGTTGLDDIMTTGTPVKVIENGQLIIIRGGVKYNVQGQKL